MGDFNEILSSEEKQVDIPRSLRLMDDFRCALLHCGLIDMGFLRNIFTWSNGRPVEAFVQECLDRACATTTWRDLFLQSQVYHIQASYSDHIPILINTQVGDRGIRRKRKPKRFEERWASYPECEHIIQEVWSGAGLSGSPMFRLFEKIRRCRMALVGWSRTLGNSKQKLEEKTKELEGLTALNNAANNEVIKKVKADINSLLFQDELFWRNDLELFGCPPG